MDEEMYFAFDNLRKWIKGTIYEGEAVLKCHEKSSHFMRNLFETSREDMNNVNDRIFLHQQNFISSINQARNWMVESTNYDESMKEVLSDIDKKIPNIRDVRNMNEHDIDYYKNRGHKQKDFMKQMEHNPTFVSDATSTIITNKGYFIGGRLNLNEALDLFKELYPLIESKLYYY